LLFVSCVLFQKRVTRLGLQAAGLVVVWCNLWVGLVSPIPPIAKLLRDPTIRALYVWLPTWLRPPLKKWGAVTKVCMHFHP
jgi:hypothetical protein